MERIIPGTRYHVVPAQKEHIPRIAARMRAADAREVAASHGHTPREALEASLGASGAAWTGFVDGKPALMWGAARTGSLLSVTGAPWMLATPLIFRVQGAFLRQSRVYVEMMQQRFARLENWCHAKNAVSLRWLRWCGFAIANAPEPYGVAGELFYKFWRHRYV